MRRFRDIKAPSPQSLWLDKGELKFQYMQEVPI